MKRLFLIVLMLLLTSPLSAADSSQKGNKNKTQGNKAGLEQTAHQLFEAITAGNLDKISGYYTADYTSTGPDGKMINGEERLKQMAAAGNNRPTLSDINVRTYGSTGVVTGMGTTKNSSGGNWPQVRSRG